MAPQAPWSPNAHAFAQHQFSHVVNFWKQGRLASFRLEALPGGRAELNVTFQLPPASEVVPPPFHPVPAYQRPIRPLFPGGFSPQGPASGPKTKPAPQKKVSSKQRKSYQRSVLHRAAIAAPSLPPPKNGSLRQAAQACFQRLQAASASPASTQSAKKRPLPDSPSALSPSNLLPLAQRIRTDIQVGESEVESPEKEVLRGSPLLENSPSPISPYAKGLSSPAPLVFTPVLLEKCETTDSDSNWEDVESEQNFEASDDFKDSDDSEDSDDSYPTIDVNSEDWAEKFTSSIRRFHKSGNFSSSHQIIDEQEEKCPNCERVFTPHHQC